MSLEGMQAKAKKVVVKLETAATGQRGFIMINKEEAEEHCQGSTKHHSQRRSTYSHHDGEIPLTQLPSNSSLLEQPPTYFRAGLGTGHALSTRRSLDRPMQHSPEEICERQT